MNRFPPTANPRLYVLSSLIIGYLLIDNFTANEQNAIGNWLMTVGQILEESCAFQQVVEERVRGNTININSEQFKNGGSPFMNNPPIDPRVNNSANNNDNNNDSSGNSSSQSNRNSNYTYENELDTLKKALDMMRNKLDELNKNN
ncbi:MAG: hypothetical protein ACI31M_04070 [Bacilli bacterium]